MKRLMALVLVSVMLCSLIACGDNSENVTPGKSENVNTNESIEEEIGKKIPLNEYERRSMAYRILLWISMWARLSVSRAL